MTTRTKNLVRTGIWTKIGKTFVVLSLFFAADVLFAAVRVEAQVDTNTVEKDDSLTLSIIASSDSGLNVEEPELPNLPDFMILNKFVQSQTSSTYENGKFQTVQKRIFNYLISPQKIGPAKIGPITVKVNGEEFKTDPITITVVAQGKAPQRQNQPPGGMMADDDDPFGFSDEAQELLNQMLRRRGLIPDRRGGAKSIPSNDREAFFVTVEVDKTRVFVGEQITTQWYLYTKGNLQNYDALKYPELRGFWKEEIEMPQRLNFEQVLVNGVPYNRALLLASALFPIAPGKKVIDSYKAKATVLDLRSSLGVFGIGRPHTYVKASKEVPVEVKPLPDAGKPKNFSGAVGQFKITGSLSSAETKVNQPVTLKIRFQGQGNVKVIELPTLELPQNLEIYDTKKEAQFLKTGQSFKEFEVLLIPRAEGKITIPSIELSYFDPAKVKYVTESTPEFTLTVKPGDGSSFTGSPLQLPESTPTAKKEGLRGLKTTAAFGLSSARLAMIWIALFGVTILFWLISLWSAWRRGLKISVSEMNRMRVAQKMKAARQKLKKRDFRATGVECSNAVLSTLGSISGAGGASLSLTLLLERLPQVDDQLKARIQNFLNRCEIMSFAPDELSKTLHTDEQGKTLVAEAETLIAKLYDLESKQAPS